MPKSNKSMSKFVSQRGAVRKKTAAMGRRARPITSKRGKVAVRAKRGKTLKRGY